MADHLTGRLVTMGTSVYGRSSNWKASYHEDQSIWQIIDLTGKLVTMGTSLYGRSLT